MRFEKLNESVDPMIQKIGDLILSSGKSLMDLRTPLQTLFPKRDIDFSFSPEAHYMIKYKGKKIIIINKKYVDDADLEVSDYAIGYM